MEKPSPQRTAGSRPGRRPVARALAKATALALVVALFSAPASSQEPPAAEKKEKGAGGEPAESVAAKYVRVKRLLEADKGQQAASEEELKRLNQEFEKGAADFSKVDDQVVAEGKQSQESKDWLAARDHLDRVIRRRSATARQLETLRRKVALLDEVLATLSAAIPPSGEKMASLVADRSSAAPPKADVAGSPAPAPAGSPSPATAAPAASVMGAIGIPAAAVPGASAPVVAVAGEEDVDERVIEAKKEYGAKQEALKGMEREVGLIDRSIDVFERDIAGTQELLGAIRDEADAAQGEVNEAGKVLEAKKGANAPAEEVKKAETDRFEAERKLGALRADEARQLTRLRTSERVLGIVREARESAAKKVEKAEADAAAVQNKLLFLQSPVAPHRVLRWLARKGPNVLGTVMAVVVIWLLVRLLGLRAVSGLVRRRGGGTDAEREGRAETLHRAFRSTAGGVFLVLGGLAVLEQAGVNVTVLFGGAAVFGAAVAFGAQSLIKDYFSGFMILVENQYSVGHTVKVGDVTGTVEDITLRVLVLRDLQGVAHFIPHSQVAKVSNMTYGWARVPVEVRVPTDADADEVMEALMEIGRGLQDDPRFRMQLIGRPEMLGIDSFGEGSMVIKLLVKTRPLSRWQIKRELLRRVKKAFDQQKIKLA